MRQRVRIGLVLGAAWLVGVTAGMARATSADGGNTTNDVDGFRIHVFTNSGTFAVTAGGMVDVLVVGGGGGGGGSSGPYGSGGGGGGLIYSNAYPVVTGSNYTVLVGGGGAGNSNGVGANGTNSVFGALTALGGGGGSSQTNPKAGSSGGSGGGGYNGGTAGTGLQPGSASGGYGNNGSVGGNVGYAHGGGGGGAGTTLPNSDGDGGYGLAFSISGSNVYYAGGGNGNASTTVVPGGGGIVNAAGAANTGGGGGGASSGNPGAGGSGIVIVRYLLGLAIANQPASGLTATSAVLNAVLQAPDTNADVRVYWGPADGTNDPLAWATNAPLGSWTDVSLTNLSFAADGLSAGTTYYYTFLATNDSTNAWASPSVRFYTLGPPAVDNDGGAANVGASLATLRGVLTAGGAAEAWICWGDDTPATPDSTGAWDHVVSVGAVSQSAPFSTGVTGLIPVTAYYYRCYVTNGYGEHWSDVTGFTTTALRWDANGATAGQTDGSGTWLNANQWWDGVANATWSNGVPDSALIGNGGAGGTITLGAVTAGRVTFTNFTGTYTLTGGSLTNSGGIADSPNSGNVTINSTIGGTGGIAKEGPNVLTLNAAAGANSYTGPTVVRGGRLQLGTGWGNADNIPGGWTGTPSTGSNLEISNGVVAVWYYGKRALGPGPGQIQLTGGTCGFANYQADAANVMLNFSNNANYEVVWGSDYFKPDVLLLSDASVTGVGAPWRMANKFDLNGATRTIAVNATGLGHPNYRNGTYGSIEGVIRSSSGTAGLIKIGPGELRLTAANTFGGMTILSNGTLTVGTALALQNSTVSLASGDTGVLTNLAAVTAYTLGGITGARDLNMGGSTVSIGNNGADTTYGGVLANGALTKTGAGALTLTGASTHAGATTINNGTLLVNGSLDAGSAALVNAGGTLGGTGLVSGAVSVQAGGTNAPGASAGSSMGVLNCGSSVTIAGTLAVEIDDSRSPMCDKLELATDLILTGATLNVIPSGTPTGKVYVIASYGGNAVGSFTVTNGLMAGYCVDTFYNRQKQVVLTTFDVLNQPVTTYSTTSAVLAAQLVAPNASAEVTVYWGPSGGMNNAASWASNAAVGAWANVHSTNIAFAIGGLTPDTTYYFTFRATNASDDVWGSPSIRFRTSPALASETLAWDGGTTNIAENGDGAGQGGSGTWDTTLNNWDLGAGVAHGSWGNGTNTAILGGAAGAVTLDAGITVGGLGFYTAGYTVRSNTLTFGSAGSIAAYGDATIASAIAGTATVAKTGGSMLTLSGTNTLTGLFSVQEGSVASTTNWVGIGRSGQQVQVGGYGTAAVWTNTVPLTIGSGAAGASNTFNVASQGLVHVNGPVIVGANANNNTASVLVGGVWDLLGKNAYIGTNASYGNQWIVSGGIVTNVGVANVYVGFNNGNNRGNSLTISDGGQWYGGNVYVGYAAGSGAYSNRYNVGGPGAASFASNRTIYVGGPVANDAGASQMYNQMTVSNATLLMSGPLTIGAGGNSFQGNQVIVDSQGTIQMGTNSIVISTSTYGYPNPTNNALVITNGGAVTAGALTVNYGAFLYVGNGGRLTNTSALIQPAGTYRGTGTATATIAGGDAASTWDLSGGVITLRSAVAGFVGLMTVDGSGVNGGAVVTNVGTLNLANAASDRGARAVLTNGARMSVSNLYLSTVAGSTANYSNALTVVGGAGVTSILDVGGGNANVGVSLDGGNNKASLATLTIGSGGIVTNVGALRVGYRPNATYGDAFGNTAAVTNGGQLFTTQDSHIGYNAGGGDGLKVANDLVAVGGAGSLWSLGGKNLSIGAGSAQPTNCVLSVSQGGVVTNLNALTVGPNGATNNAIALSPGGRVCASNATIRAGNKLQVVLNDAVSKDAGVLSAATSLDISGAALQVSVAGPVGQWAYTIATYGALTGTFAVTNDLPAGWTVQYDHDGGTAIALVTPFGSGAVLIVR